MAKQPVIRIRRARATAADLDRLTPLFVAYRRFYKKPPRGAAARRYLAERLRRGDASWEAMVPGAAVELIKSRRLLGYRDADTTATAETSAA